MDEDKNTNQNSAENIRKELEKLSKFEEDINQKKADLEAGVIAPKAKEKNETTKAGGSLIFDLMFNKKDRKIKTDQETLENLHNKKEIEIPQKVIESTKTFEKDTKNVFDKKDTTLTKIAIKEKEREKERGYKNPYFTPVSTSSKNKETKMVFLISVMMTIVGLSFFGYFFINKTTTTEEPPKTESILLETEIVNIQSLDRSNLIQAFSSARAKLNQKSLSFIEIKKSDSENITFQEFIEAIKGNQLASFSRAVEDNFLIGSSNDEIFIIIRIKSFEGAFAGMLAWESSMTEDLKGIFLKQPVPFAKFEDKIISNADVRASQENSLQEKILYSFPNRQFLIIASGESSFQKVLETFF